MNTMLSIPRTISIAVKAMRAMALLSRWSMIGLRRIVRVETNVFDVQIAGPKADTGRAFAERQHEVGFAIDFDRIRNSLGLESHRRPAFIKRKAVDRQIDAR